MKRCSTCNRTYTDPNLSFCIDDGTPLTTVDADDDATVVTPRKTEADDWNSPAYQPPRGYVPPGAEVKQRRRLWPWIVGLLGAFILGITFIAIAATVIAPRLVKRVEQERINRTDRPRQATPENTQPAQPETPDNVNAPVPTDDAQVLAQLTQIENEWSVANINADKKKLERILADDFIGTGPEGEKQTKADYIRQIQRDNDVDKWEFNNLKLALTGDRATLKGTIKYIFLDGRALSFDFIDRFVWRDGRWQATGAELINPDGPEFNL